MRTLGRMKKIILGIILFLIVIISVNLYTSKHHLKTTNYQIDLQKLNSALTILHLTDLHNSEFGDNNAKLVQQISEANPDLILITGDLLDSGSERTDIAESVIEQLVEIAPVYISLGNHEVEYVETYGVDPASIFEAAGAVVLEQEYVDLTVNGQEIRIGGLYGYALSERIVENSYKDDEEKVAQAEFISDFENTDALTILMCHMPVSWIAYGGIEDWDVDLVYTGHVHGGQVIFPAGIGLYAPDFGWFPGKLYGLYYSEDESKIVVLSRGLGSTELIPRFNNVPEIVITELQ